MKTKFINSAISTSVVFILSSSAVSAQSIDALRKRQSTLEAELDRVKSQISEIENRSSQQVEPERTVTWYIREFGISEVNSAGGVEPYFVFVNPNINAPIKYINIRALLYNAVGDVISSDIGRQTTAGLSFTGPLSNSDGEKRSHWGPVWYNTTGKCIKLTSIVITFTNGKVATFDGKTLKGALAPEIENTCAASKG